MKKKINKIMKNEEMLLAFNKLCITYFDHSQLYKNQALLDAIEGADYYHMRRPKSSITGGAKTVAPIVKTKVDDASVQIIDIISKLKQGSNVVPAEYGKSFPPQMVSSILTLIEKTLWTRVGRKTLRAAVRDSLICGTSAISWYVEEEPIYSIEMYNDLSKLELEMLKADLQKNQELDITNESKVEGMEDSEFGNKLYDAKITTTTNQKTVKYRHVSFNDLQVDPNAVCLSEANFVSIQSISTKAALIEQGYDPVKVRASTSESYYDQRAQVNTGVDFVPEWRLMSNMAGDRDIEEVVVYEQYVRTTLVDKKLKLYRVVRVGSTILDITPVDYIPAVEIMPIPNISYFWGSSFAYQLRSQQDIATALKRGYIDNIHNANHNRMTALQGQYNKRDMLDNRPNGIVEIEVPNAIQPFPYNPLPQGIDNLLAYIDKEADDISGISQEMLGRGENSWSTNITAAQVAITHSKGDLTIKDYAQGILFGIQELAKGIYSEWRKIIGAGDEGQGGLPEISEITMILETESGRRSKATDAIATYTTLAQTKFMSPELEFELIKNYLANASQAHLVQFLKPVEMVMQEAQQPNPANELQQALVKEQVNNLQAQTKLTLQKADIEADVAASEQDREDTKLKLEIQTLGVEMSLKDRKQTNEEFKTAIDAEIAQKQLQTTNLVAAYEMKYKETFAGGDLIESMGGDPTK